MKKNAAVVENGEVVNWIVVEVDSKGKAKGMKDHPLAGKIEIPANGAEVGIGYIKSANGFERKPETPDAG